jgi:hypothetical protein
LGIGGEKLVVVFMKKRGVTGDDGPVDFQPKNALGRQGDTVLGDESEDCLLGEDHHKSKGAVAERRQKTDTKYPE